jgi:uncharacterized membrane protein
VAVRGGRPRWGPIVGVCALAGFTIVLWGGYDRRWHWTGFSANHSLWDWLHLLMLPIALAAVPLWLVRRRSIHRRGRIVLAGAVSAFVVLVGIGYALDLRWTGFQGNTLWDWLQLFLVPLAVPLIVVPAALAWLVLEERPAAEDTSV